MHLSALLEGDVVAVGQTAELTLLVELTAPMRPSASADQAPRRPAGGDRSGSAAGWGRHRARARTAGPHADRPRALLLDLVDRLLARLVPGRAGTEALGDPAAALAGAVAGGPRDEVARSATLRVLLTPHAVGIDVRHDLSAVDLPDGVLLDLGSFHAQETRRLALTLALPGIASPGRARVATLELTHVALPDLVQCTTSLPVHVEVVPAYELADGIAYPESRAEDRRPAQRRGGVTRSPPPP